MLPGASTLERIVASVVAHATTDLFETISGRLPEKLRAAIDLLVEVPEGDARSSLFRLKDYPKSANAAVIKGDIVRLRLIEQLLGDRRRSGRSRSDGSCANSANSGAATMPAISAASPSPSATRWSPAIWSRRARRCSTRSSR